MASGRRGQAGTWISELLPHIGTITDDICVIKSLHTEAINHDPATTYIQTGSQQPGRPSFGAWLSYGLGCESDNLPAFIVMISQGSGNKTDQPLFSRLWGSGFLPSEHQGVRFRTGNDPVLYLSNPPGIDAEDTPLHARRHRASSTNWLLGTMPTRKSKRASRSMKWLFACKPRCRS